MYYVKVLKDKIVTNRIIESNLKLIFGTTDESELKKLNIYRLVDIKPDLLLGQSIIKSTISLVNSIPTVNYTIKDNLALAKKLQKQKIKSFFEGASLRPRVFVKSLNFSVDGSREDLSNLENARLLKLTKIKDADNNFQTIKLADWDIILNAIRQAGFSLFNKKWELEAKVDVCETVEQVNSIDISIK